MDAKLSHVSLDPADYAVIAVYMLGLTGMGFYYRKFAQQNLEHYFLAGRKFKGWIAGTSYAVTCMNADVLRGPSGDLVSAGVNAWH